MSNSTFEYEVENLHGFFQDWFNGLLPGDGATFARFEDALEPGFTIVLPTGETLDRAGILEAVRQGYGRSADEAVQIWVDNVVVHELTGDEVAVCYEEWQSGAEGRRGRSSRALMRPNPSAPGGVEWVRVDEVWLD